MGVSTSSDEEKVLNMLSLGLAFLLFGVAASQQTVCNCTVETDSEIYPVVLDILSQEPQQDCQVIDEELCIDKCTAQGQALDYTFNLTNAYPRDAQGRSYGAVWCDRINQDLQEENFDRDWWISAFSLVQGERCLFPALPSWGGYLDKTLCCYGNGTFDPTCDLA